MWKSYTDHNLRQIWSRSFSASGFAGYNGLTKSDHFIGIAHRVTNQTNKLIERVKTIPPGIDIVKSLDKISDSVCSVADIANFCYCVHPNENWRTKAQHAFQFLMKYISQLNINQDLFYALKATIEKQQDTSSNEYWSKEAIIVSESLYRDFLSSGIDKKSRDKILRLISSEHRFGSQFQRTVAQHSEINALSIKDCSFLPDHLQSLSVKHINQYHLPMTPAIYHAISHSVEAESVRKEAFLAHFTSLSENINTLEQLLKTRREWANAIGWESFVAFKLQNSIAVNPSSIEYFLQGITKSTREGGKEEISTLERLKGSKVYPWDIPYYTSKARMQKLSNHGSKEPLMFKLQSVINGLSRFLSEFMGVEITKDEDIDFLWSPSVQKLTFWNSSREVRIGDLYLDLFERKHKVPENAHYTLRCGRLLADGSYQTPIVALVTNFTQPRITFYELKTLLHEFGHVLHSLLSKTHFQHLFGTRGPLDLVEIPSHFFENMILSPEALQYLSGLDEQTNKLIPISILKNTIEANSMFQNLRILDQVQIAMIDQKLHGKDIPVKGFSISTIVEEVMTEYGLIPYIPNTFREAWMTHLVSYGACYYAYIYSRHVANLAWELNISPHILDKQRWTSIQRKLFRPGGAVNPQEYVWSLIGKENLISNNGNGWTPLC